MPQLDCWKSRFLLCNHRKGSSWPFIVFTIISSFVLLPQKAPASKIGTRPDGHSRSGNICRPSQGPNVCRNSSNPCLRATVCGERPAKQACHGRPIRHVRLDLPLPLSLSVRGDLISSFVPTRLGQLPTKPFSKKKLTSRPFSCWRAGEAQASNGRCRGTTALSPDTSPRNADTFRRDRKGEPGVV